MSQAGTLSFELNLEGFCCGDKHQWGHTCIVKVNPPSSIVVYTTALFLDVGAWSTDPTQSTSALLFQTLEPLARTKNAHFRHPETLMWMFVNAHVKTRPISLNILEPRSTDVSIWFVTRGYYHQMNIKDTFRNVAACPAKFLSNMELLFKSQQTFQFLVACVNSANQKECDLIFKKGQKETPAMPDRLRLSTQQRFD